MWHAYSQQKYQHAQKASKNAASNSRFSHFKGMMDTLDNADGMVIVAGVGFRPPVFTPGLQVPGITGVFVTNVVGESTSSNSFTTTVVKPNATNENIHSFSYSPQKDRDPTNEVIGHVTVSQERDGEERTLVQRILKLPNDQLKPIVVYLLDHNNQDKHKITVRQADTVQFLRAKLWHELSIPEDEILVYSGKTLTDGHTLGYYKIKENCTINLMTNMVGG
ncbi:hypothetical protein BsWGS_23310 [Bradybaena similaris]